MGRERYLAKTLSLNLRAIESSGIACEFVLLDYGSKGGAFDYARWEFPSGILRPFRMEAEYWSHPHAKNVAHRLSRGEILVDLDSDVWIRGPSTIRCISNLSKDAFGQVGWRTPSLGGFIAVWRDHFWAVRGYDEAMLSWNRNDYDLKMRLYLDRGIKPVIGIADLSAIDHSHEERIENLPPSQKSLLAEQVNVLYSAQGSKMKNVNPAGWGAAVVQAPEGQIILPPEPIGLEGDAYGRR